MQGCLLTIASTPINQPESSPPSQTTLREANPNGLDSGCKVVLYGACTQTIRCPALGVNVRYRALMGIHSGPSLATNRGILIKAKAPTSVVSAFASLHKELRLVAGLLVFRARRRDEDVFALSGGRMPVRVALSNEFAALRVTMNGFHLDHIWSGIIRWLVTSTNGHLLEGTDCRSLSL